MGSAKGVVHKDVAQGGELFGQIGVILLFAFVDAAVFQQHHLAGLNRNAVYPMGDQRNLTAQQLAQALGNGGQRVFWSELAFGGATQVGGDHDGSTSVQGHLDAGHAGADAGVFGDVACVVLGDVQVSTDEDALILGTALGAEVGEADEFHRGLTFQESKNFRLASLPQADQMGRIGTFNAA